MIVFLAGVVAGVYLSRKFAGPVGWLIDAIQKFRPRFTRIVRFKDDRYAVRWSIGPFRVYKDLWSPGYWWGRNNPYFKDCLGSLEQCEASMTAAGEYGEPVEWSGPEKATGEKP